MTIKVIKVSKVINLNFPELNNAWTHTEEAEMAPKYAKLFIFEVMTYKSMIK